MFVETGLLGLAAFLTVLFAIWRRAWRSYQVLQVPWHRGLVLGYVVGFGDLLVHALAANTFSVVRIMAPFFIFTGVVLVLAAIKRGEGRVAPGEAAAAALHVQDPIGETQLPADPPVQLRLYLGIEVMGYFAAMHVRHRTFRSGQRRRPLRLKMFRLNS